MVYKYTESGLDNVVLVNGYTIEDHPHYGELVSIENISGLHRAIAEQIVNLQRPMNGAEFRFLRTEMDLSQKSLAAILGVTDQAVAKWEKNKKKPVSTPSAERLLRVFYSERTEGDGEVHRILKRIAELDAKIGEMDFRLQKNASGWNKAA